MEGDTLPPRISARSTVDSSRCFSLLFCTLRVSEGYFLVADVSKLTVLFLFKKDETCIFYTENGIFLEKTHSRARP